MAVETSIVVEFGDATPGESDIVVVEFNEDHANNLNSSGDIKSTFAVGEQPVFMVHHSSLLRIDSVRATHGSVNLIGNNLTKEREKEVLFPTLETEESLSYASPVLTSQEWYGNEGNLVITGNQAVLTGGIIPCLGDITFNVVFNAQYMLIPPPLTLAADETYKIVIVIYMERV